ncbi:MAG: TIR domain-containing protein [Sulfuritalea sp.]|nr:TIR domain-containing protein [Sulfuritalea sp.]MDP1981573.1 TIR domain-containing protein [Sulfuritalea sp.]
MGGGGGGSRGIGDLRSLVDKAKEELREGERQGRRNVFISFAYEDIDEVNLMRGQARNENVPLEFNDWSVPEPYESERAAYLKQKIGERIAQSSVTVVYVSEHSTNSKWVEWEIEESLRRGKHVLAVHKGDVPPTSIPEAVLRHGLSLVRWGNLAQEIAGLD